VPVRRHNAAALEQRIAEGIHHEWPCGRHIHPAMGLDQGWQARLGVAPLTNMVLMPSQRGKMASRVTFNLVHTAGS
jgi:hypothetical protein